MSAANHLEDVFFDRIVSYQATIDQMGAKVIEIFDYSEELPITIPKRILETLLTQDGKCVFYEHEGDYFVSDFNETGDEDVYGEAHGILIEHLGDTLERTAGVDAVIVRNDSGSIGLSRIIQEYALLMGQAKLSILRTLVNLREPIIFQAKDEDAKDAAIEYEKEIRAGAPSVILAEELDPVAGLVVHQRPQSQNNATQIIELVQYVQSMYWSELGVNVANNYKREYVSEGELEASSGMPLVRNMLRERQVAMRDIKALFDIDIKVRISPEWEQRESENPDGNEETDQETDGLGTPGDPDAPGDADEAAATGGEEPAGDADEEAAANGDAETDEGAAAETEEGFEAEEDGEVADVSSEELIEATEALLGEEVTADEPETDSDPAAGSDSAEPEADQADEDGDGMGTTEDDEQAG